MYVVDDVVYASEMTPGIAVRTARSVGNLCMLVEFSTGETRLFDASPLLGFSAFEALADETVFANVAIEHGIITWMNGELDIATEKVYRMSYEYEVAA